MNAAEESWAVVEDMDGDRVEKTAAGRGMKMETLGECGSGLSSGKLLELPPWGASHGPGGFPAPGRASLWISRLKAYVGPASERTSEAALEMEVQERLHAILDERRREREEAKEEASTSSEAAAPDIPTFYVKKPPDSSLAARKKRVARLKFLKRQADALLDAVELEAVWMHLRQNVSGPDDPSSQGDKINYDDFCQVAAICVEEAGPKCKRFFTPSTFMMFEMDDYGRIPILPFYLYIMRTISLTQTRIDLCTLDSDGDGYLKLPEMEAYLKRLVPNLPQLKSMEFSFLSLYCRIAARKFFFFCDPQRRGKLLIRELLMSPVLSELMELRQENEGDEGIQGRQQLDNWFSLRNARRIYNMFLLLDKDMNGTLSKQELLDYGDGNLTDIFVERLFDEHVKRVRGDRGAPREMDMNSFVDFVLAMENKHTAEGLSYMFRCLDIHSQGFITTAEVHTLFREVHRKWIDAGNYDFAIEDVRDEIWDMVKPKDPLRITLRDLMECRQGDTVAAMLIDVGGFWQHDNRESLAQQEDDQAASPALAN